MALRYLFFTAHYRTFLNFTWESLTAAQNGLHQLRSQISNFKFQIENSKRTVLSEEKLQTIDDFRGKFMAALVDDLNMPQALAVLWEVVKSNIPSQDKWDLAMEFDKVLGLELSSLSHQQGVIPEDIALLLNKREDFRKANKFDEADVVRREIESRGFLLMDTSSGPVISPR